LIFRSFSFSFHPFE